jgi:hypothetical protein
VYIAHCQIAYKAGRLTYAASSRELAERAGVSHMTASRATYRLCGGNLLQLEREAVGDCANVYNLQPNGQTVTLPITPSVRKCNTMSHDVFRWSGLYKSAGEVWCALQQKRATVEELANQTGRNEKTVIRALERMTGIIDSVKGEIVDMVEFDGKYWHAIDVDLDLVAKLIGTSGDGQRQKEKHERERKLHRCSLLYGQTQRNMSCRSLHEAPQNVSSNE